MANSIRALESFFLSPFWIPLAVQVDNTFKKDQFRDILDEHGVKLRVVPPRRHRKNVLESKHGIIRSIVLRLFGSKTPVSPYLSALRAIQISTGIYGLETRSAFEIGNGCTRSVANAIFPVPDNLLE